MLNYKQIQIEKIEDLGGSMIEKSLHQLQLISTLINDDDADFEIVPEALMKEEYKINKLELKLSRRVINSIALFEPKARELRELIAYVHLTTTLERISDHCVNISRDLTDTSINKLQDPFKHLITAMLERATSMTHRACVAFTSKDIRHAEEIIKEDELVDSLFQDLKAAARKVDQAIDFPSILAAFNIASNIERIADLATNIAESSIFMVDGDDIKHPNVQS